MKSVFRSDGAKLIPTDTDGAEFCSKHTGKDLMVEVKMARNPGHHRKFFALLNLLWRRTECGEKYPSRNALRYALTMAAGYTEVVPTRKGEVLVPKSLAFESMDQTEFNELYDACVSLIIKEILPHMSEEDLRRELLEFAA